MSVVAENIVFEEAGTRHLPFLEQGFISNVLQRDFVFLIKPSAVVGNGFMSAEEVCASGSTGR